MHSTVPRHVKYICHGLKEGRTRACQLEQIGFVIIMGRTFGFFDLPGVPMVAFCEKGLHVSNQNILFTCAVFIARFLLVTLSFLVSKFEKSFISF